MVDEKRNGILDALYIKELKELSTAKQEINTGEAMQVGILNNGGQTTMQMMLLIPAIKVWVLRFIFLQN